VIASTSAQIFTATAANMMSNNAPVSGASNNPLTIPPSIVNGTPLPACSPAVTIGTISGMLPVDVETIRLFLHVLAATVWVGGQITLGGLVPVLRRAGAEVPRLAAQQFGRIAWTAFGVLVVTGVWNMAVYEGKDRSGYQATIGLKLTFVVLSAIGAVVHTRGNSRRALALGGAAAALFSLGALFLGIVLGQ
jgi:putative copper export protein